MTIFRNKLDPKWIGQVVSSGTLREEDLIPAFELVLGSIGIHPERPEAVNRLLDGEQTSAQDWDAIGWYLSEELFDAMNDVAPEGTYFGASEGDGSLFGFWISEVTPEEPC